MVFLSNAGSKESPRQRCQQLTNECDVSELNEDMRVRKHGDNSVDGSVTDDAGSSTNHDTSPNTDPRSDNGGSENSGILKQWSKYLSPKWLPSCNGCLTQVDDSTSNDLDAKDELRGSPGRTAASDASTLSARTTSWLTADQESIGYEVCHTDFIPETRPVNASLPKNSILSIDSASTAAFKSTLQPNTSGSKLPSYDKGPHRLRHSRPSTPASILSASSSNLSTSPSNLSITASKTSANRRVLPRICQTPRQKRQQRIRLLREECDWLPTPILVRQQVCPTSQDQPQVHNQGPPPQTERIQEEHRAVSMYLPAGSKGQDSHLRSHLHSHQHSHLPEKTHDQLTNNHDGKNELSATKKDLSEDIALSSNIPHAKMPIRSRSLLPMSRSRSNPRASIPLSRPSARSLPLSTPMSLVRSTSRKKSRSKSPTRLPSIIRRRSRSDLEVTVPTSPPVPRPTSPPLSSLAPSPLSQSVPPPTSPGALSSPGSMQSSNTTSPNPRSSLPRNPALQNSNFKKHKLSSLRRTQSLQPVSSPSLSSPTSVADFGSHARKNSGKGRKQKRNGHVEDYGVEHWMESVCCYTDDRFVGADVNTVVTTTPNKPPNRINHTRSGSDGFFSESASWDWGCGASEGFTCCYPLEDDPDSKKAKAIAADVGCGGYYDYSGTYHPCTKLRKDIAGWHEKCQGCLFRRGNVHTNELHQEKEEEELFYDSDPGQHFAIENWSCRRRRLDEEYNGPHSSGAQAAKQGWRQRRRHSKSRDTALMNAQLQQRHRHAYLYDYFSRQQEGNAIMSTGETATAEIEVSRCVQEALNSKWRLQWHAITLKNKQTSTFSPHRSTLPNSPNSQQFSPTGKPDSSRSSLNNNINLIPPPKLCDVWIERGCRRNRTEIVEPKLMWREISQPLLHDKRMLGGSAIRPYRVSLLAIRRVLCVSKDMKKLESMLLGENASSAKGGAGDSAGTSQSLLPPMAKPNCLLLIRSSLGEDYLFEASCPEERDRIVHLWKMTTARLVSHAVVGDGERMVNEFFNEWKVSGGVYTSLVSSD